MLDDEKTFGELVKAAIPILTAFMMIYFMLSGPYFKFESGNTEYVYYPAMALGGLPVSGILYDFLRYSTIIERVNIAKVYMPAADINGHPAGLDPYIELINLTTLAWILCGFAFVFLTTLTALKRLSTGKKGNSALYGAGTWATIGIWFVITVAVINVAQNQFINFQYLPNFWYSIVLVIVNIIVYIVYAAMADEDDV